MGCLFARLGPATSHVMSKRDRKELCARTAGAADQKAEYRMYALPNRVQVVRLDGRSLFFQHYGRLFPTVAHFAATGFRRVTLNEHALAPMLRGAPVMGPGLLVCADLCAPFEKDEILGVEVVGHGVVAVGVALRSFEDVRARPDGPAVDVLHHRGDALDREDF